MAGVTRARSCAASLVAAACRDHRRPPLRPRYHRCWHPVLRLAEGGLEVEGGGDDSAVPDEMHVRASASVAGVGVPDAHLQGPHRCLFRGQFGGARARVRWGIRFALVAARDHVSFHPFWPAWRRAASAAQEGGHARHAPEARSAPTWSRAEAMMTFLKAQDADPRELLPGDGWQRGRGWAS